MHGTHPKGSGRNSRSVTHARGLRAIVLAGFLIAGLWPLAGELAAQETKPAAEQPAIPTQNFAAGYDLVWDKLLVTLKSFDVLAVTNADKAAGKMMTAPYRYFKISSAKFPPVQDDYRDTYELFVEKKADKNTQVQIKRKFEFYDRTKPPNGDWVQREDIPNKAGISSSDIFNALNLEIAAAGLPAAR